MDGAERDEQDQEVDGDGHREGDEGGARDVLLGLLDLLGNGGDEVVALEGDEGQTHGDDHTACAEREEGREAGSRLGRGARDLLEPVGDEDHEYEQLGHGEGVLGGTGHRSAPNVEAEKNEPDDHGDDGNRQVVSGG